ncbi:MULTISPECIES: hypothetical protein [unclassified Bradyrhizobium]|uniref:hypothetical protein n=1 Tax=unclassified Bradyrhizobium TaxID=2631580 RepID=UPI001FF8E840|nr:MULTISPECIES: hypothetical protein [unclassified Bradyrhizobium]MCK1663357.1 hypothetical protein [Bradyrhizobium sp. 151]UPK27651.1 hypothetical protein IVB26_03295 [Bradyrhizobium sp. 195]
MNNLMGDWWPWCLLVGGGVLLWVLDYGAQDRTPIILLAALVTAAGGCLVLAERQKRK